MSGSYKSSIGISITLDPQNKVKSDLEQLLNKLSQTSKLNISVNPQINQQLNDVSQTINNIYNQTNRPFTLNSLTKSAEESSKVFQDLGNQIGRLHEKSDIKINTSNSLQEAKEVNKILNENYKAGIKEAEAQNQVQQEIQKQIRLLEIRKQSLNRQFGDKIDISSIDEYINKLKSMNNVNMKGLKGEISNIQVGIKQLVENAKSSEGIFSRLGNSLRNVGIYIDITDVIRAVSTNIKDTIEYVVKLDTAMTNLKKVTNETNETYSSFLNQAHDIAMEYGSQADKVVDATTSWAKTGESLRNATELAKSTMLLTKVGDVENIATAQQYMIAPLKAFNIEAEKSVTLIDKYNNISNNMATSTNDLGEALSKSASSMSTAGNTLEQTLALIATAESQTKLGGDVVGQAFKTVSLRIATFKNEDGELIPKFEKKLESLGVTMRDTVTGQILPTFEILKQVGEKFKTLDTNTKLDISQMLGGKLQANVVSSVLNNVDELNRAYQLASNSSNSAMNEFKTYQQGVQYSIDQLKESISNMYKEALDSSTLKGFIDILTSLISKFGNLPSVISLATTAILIFKGQALTSLISDLMAVTAGESAMSLATIGVSSAFNALKVAMATNPFGMVALAITSLIIAMDAFGTSSETIKQQNEQLISSIQSLNSEVKSIDDLKDRYVTLKESLESNTLTTEQAKTKKQELYSVYSELISKAPELEGVLNNEKLSYEEQSKAIQNVIDLKRQELALKSEKYFDDNNINDKSLQQKIDQLKRYQEEMNGASRGATMSDEELSKKGQLSWWSSGDTVREQFKHNELEMKQKIMDLNQSFQTIVTNYNTLNSLGLKSPISDEMLQKIKDVSSGLNTYNSDLENTNNKSGQTANNTKLVSQAMGELKQNSALSSDMIVKLASAFPSIGINANNAKQKVQELNETLNKTNDSEPKVSTEQMTKNFSDAVQKAGELREIAQKLNKEQKITPDIIKSVAEAIPDIGTRITSVQGIQEALNQKIAEEEDIQISTYKAMVGNDENYYSSKIKNSSETQTAIANILAQYVNVDEANGLATSLQNFTTAEQAKAEVTRQIVKSIAGMWAEYWDSMTSDFNSTLYGGIDLSGKDVNTEQFQAKTKQYEQMVAIRDKIRDASKKLDGALYSGASFTPSSIDTPNFGSSKGDKSAEKAQKMADEIAKMQSDIKPDRYLDLNNAVKQVDNSLSENKTLKDALKKDSPEYQNALLKDIQLYKDKQVALNALNVEQKKEAEELKNKLASYDFEFDATGKLINSQKKLMELQTNINNMGGSTEADKEKKKEYIDWLKEINDDIKQYGELTGDKIPKTTELWNEQANEIKKVNEEMKDALATFRDKVAGYILEDLQAKQKKAEEDLDSAEKKKKKALEDAKKAKADELDAQIKALQDQIKALDDESADNEKKLAKLKAEKSAWMKDDSALAKGKISELDDKIKETEKTIQKDNLNKQIENLQSEKDKSDTNYDKQLSDLDDYYEKKKEQQKKSDEDSKLEEKAYEQADKMLKNNHQKEIIDLMTKYGKSYKDVGSLLGQNFKDGWIAQIEQAKEEYSSLMGDIGTINNTSNSTSNSSQTTKSVDTSGIDGKLNLNDIEDGKYYKGTTTRGSKYKVDSDGNVKFDFGTLTDVELADIKKHIARYETGGRTPSDISNGGLAIVDPEEKILNQKDTIMIDEIYDYIKNSGNIIGQLTGQYTNPSNYSLPNLVGTNLNGIASNVTNTSSTDNSITQPISMQVSIVNEKGAEQFTEQKLYKVIDKWQREQGRRFR